MVDPEVEIDMGIENILGKNEHKVEETINEDHHSIDQTGGIHQ